MNAQVDKIFKAAALAANAQRIPLAKLAVEETRMGVLEDKVIKIAFRCVAPRSFVLACRALTPAAAAPSSSTTSTRT